MRGRLAGSLVLFTLVGGAGLGCGASGAGATPDSGAPDAPEALELFTWWVAPGEVEALGALVNVYKAAHPMARVNQFNDASGKELSEVARSAEILCANSRARTGEDAYTFHEAPHLALSFRCATSPPDRSGLLARHAALRRWLSGFDRLPFPRCRP